MKIDWRQGILYVTLLGTEGCWLYALLVLLNRKVADGGLSTLWLLFLYPVAFGFNRLLRRLRWPEFSLRIISWLAWVVATLLIVKFQLFSSLAWSDAAWLMAIPRAIADVLYTFGPELLILVSTVALWWLGRHLACIEVNFSSLVGRFQFGLVILIIALLVASQLKLELADSVTVTLVFFLFALTGISIAHALEGTSWLSGLYQGHWSGLLLVSIGVIILLGLLIGSVITTDLLQIVVDGLKWLWGLIMKLVALIVSLLPEPEPSELPPPAPPAPEMEPSAGFKLWSMPESVRRFLQSGWSILFFGIFLVALWRISTDIFRWLRRRFPGRAGAEYEAMPGAFRADLLSWLKRIVLGLFGVRRLFQRGKRPTMPEVASVRELYRRFLRWTAAGGYPRHIYQTPHEYLYTLADLLPEARQDLAFMTQQYVSARYGTLPQTEDELRQLRESWRKVKQNNLKQMSRNQARGQEVNVNGQSS